MADPLDAEIDAMIAGGASLADHEGRWPRYSELRHWFWSTAFDGRAEAVDSRRELMKAFGASEEQARLEAETFASKYGYLEPHQKARSPWRGGRSLIAEIKSRLRVEDVALRLTDIPAHGRTRKARCPFHDDRTPSFVVYTETQRWFCFGACARGGDVLDLVQAALDKGLRP